MYLCYVDESGTPDVPGNTASASGTTPPLRVPARYARPIGAHEAGKACWRANLKDYFYGRLFKGRKVGMGEVD